MKIKPRQAGPYVSMGYAYAELGKLAEALSVFRQAIELKYDMPHAWAGLARVYLESGRPGAAHTAWGILRMQDAQLAARLGPAFLQRWGGDAADPRPHTSGLHAGRRHAPRARHRELL